MDAIEAVSEAREAAQQQTVELNSPKTAEIFRDQRNLRLFSPFVDRPYSVVDAATLVQTSESTMRRSVKRFVDAGLLRRSAPNGTGAQRYELVAPRILVAMPKMPQEPLEDLRASHQDNWDRFTAACHRESGLYADEPFVVEIESLGEGGGRVRSLPRRLLRPEEVERAPALPLNTWGRVGLTPQQARQLRANLMACVEDFLAAHRGPQTPVEAVRDVYLLHLGMVRERL